MFLLMFTKKYGQSSLTHFLNLFLDQSERFPNRHGTEPTKVFYSEVKKNRVDNEQ